MAHDFGWEVWVELDGNRLVTTHCSNWRQVEWLCAWLNRRFAFETPFSSIDHVEDKASAA
jgi:hypothetical protein